MPYEPQRGTTTSKDRKRLIIITCSILGLFSLLILQFFRLQIVQGEKWAKIARSQHQIMITEPFKRGIFYSNNTLKPSHPTPAQPLVHDIPYFHLYVDALSIPQKFREEVSKNVTLKLDLGKKEYDEMMVQLLKKSHSRKLALWLDKGSQEKVLSWWNGFARKNKIATNALYFVQDYKRSSPYGKLLGSVLHTLRDSHDASSQESIPTGGLELFFNKVLQGKQGKRLLLRSPQHPMDSGKVVSYPENGADVYLTINHHLQAIAEEEIQKAVIAANAKGGWAILMDPYSGEILAMAQYPSFDPSHYQDYFNNPKLLDDTKVKGITDPYEPGSIMKPISMAISLMANKELIKNHKKPVFSPEEKLACSDGRFPGRSKPIKDVHPHGYLNMYMGLQKSSNIYVARIIQRVVDALGPEWYRAQLETFGFGQKTHMELPGESAGLLPALGKKHPNGALEWSTPTPYSLAMGYNLLATSAQMLRAYGIIANGGFEVKPTLVRKISRKKQGGKEEVLLDNFRQHSLSAPKRLIDEDVIRTTKKAMKFTTKPGGSASRADILGYTEAGKTGTSEKIVKGQYCKDTHISTFVGFAPVEKPRFVLLIAIDEPEKKYIPGRGKNQMGGICAAPVFREIGTKVLQYLGVKPDDPFGYPTGDPRRNEEKADYARELKELKSLYQAWN